MVNGMLPQSPAPIDPNASPIDPNASPIDPNAAPMLPPDQQQPSGPAPTPSQQQRDYRANPLGPKDAEALEIFNITATKLIHSPETRDKVLKRIGVSQKGPIDDISDLTIALVDRIDQQIIKETGQPVDDAVKIQGANSVVGQIIEVAEASGKVPKMTADEKAVTFTHAVQKYTSRMIQRGEITKEELMGSVQEAQSMGQQLGSGPGDTSAAASNDTAPVVSSDTAQPNQTMSQRLAEKGILDDI